MCSYCIHKKRNGYTVNADTGEFGQNEGTEFNSSCEVKENIAFAEAEKEL